MIYSWLQNAIISGALTPGQVLRQEELAARFKTSRVPLREALQSLQAEGLVVLRPRRGYAVASHDAKQLIGLLQLRILVEGYAGYVGTRHRTLSDVKTVGQILQEMEKLPLKLSREAQRQRWSLLNRQFHAGIFAASGNEHLSQIAANLSAKLDPYIMTEQAMSRRLENSRDAHRKIFEAFSAGDAEAVGRLSRQHCEGVASSFLAWLQETGAATDIQPAELTDLGPAVSMANPRPAAARKPSRN